jgi:putative transposase
MRRRVLSHTVYQQQFHIVWGTKYRRKFITPYVKTELSRVIYNFIKTQPTLHIEALNTDRDHVHMQIEIPPNILVSSVVQRLKWISSIKLKKKFSFIKKMYLKHQSIWSVGYFSSTVGLDEEMIHKYIEYQGRKELPTQVKLGFS